MPKPGKSKNGAARVNPRASDEVGWTVVESGGSPAGRGTVVHDPVSDQFVLTEGDSFLVSLERSVIVPDSPSVLQFTYTASFDTADTEFIHDAFEAALVAADGLPVVPIIRSGRDSYFNHTENESAALGGGTTVVGQTVEVDISKLESGSSARLMLRLVGDDSDVNTTVHIDCEGGAGPVKFYVPDKGSDAAFRYDAAGAEIYDFSLAALNAEPRGADSNAAGDTLWVVDSSAKVFVYNVDGTLRGSWQAVGSFHPEGIATDGTHIWIVEDFGPAFQDKVRYYAGAASRTSGSQSAASSFNLNSGNVKPTGLATDGNTIWVSDLGTSDAARVYVYSTQGVFQGFWKLPNANHDPSGITINPSGGNDLWLVDRVDLLVYHYADGRTWTSGSHTATGTFPLAAGNTQPEGIADPPAISLSAPPPESTAAPDTTLLVSGRAESDDSRVTYVTLDGVPVEAFDAGGNFFSRVPIAPGDNPFTLQATDDLAQTATTSVTVTGANAPPAALDFSELVPAVSMGLVAEYGQTSFHDQHDVLLADLELRNDGSFAIDTPLLVGVAHLSDPTIRVRNADGYTPSTLDSQPSTSSGGIPYYDVSKFILDGTLSPGETTCAPEQSQCPADPFHLEFYNSGRIQFTYDLVVFGRLNRPPAFTTVPVIEALVGYSYAYDSDATDPDDDSRTFSPIEKPFFTCAAGSTTCTPDEMTVNAATGLVQWTPSATQIGNHSVTIRVDDGRGGYDTQHYVVTVRDVVPNRPPNWTSTPIVEAYVNMQYEYLGTAADPDNDTLLFSQDTPPDGLSINPSTGLVTWVPNEDQLGVNDVVLKVKDGRGGQALQPYTILVQQQPGNHPPVFVTTPQTRVDNGLLLDLDSVVSIPGVLDQTVSETFDWISVGCAGGAPPGQGNPPCLLAAEFGMFRVLDNLGRVGDYYPGDPEYLVTALSSSNRRVLFPYPTAQVSGPPVSVSFTAGDAYVLYLIENGTTDAYLNSLPNGGPPITSIVQAHFSIASLNLSDQDELHAVIDGVADSTTLTWTVDTALEQPGSQNVEVVYGVNDALWSGVHQVYTYPSRAVDPDDDVLTYSLPQAQSPVGAVIPDPATGVIRWLTDNGTYPFTVRADDGRGGFDTQSFTVTVTLSGAGTIYGRKFAGDPPLFDCDPMDAPSGGVYVHPITLLEISGQYARPIGMDYYEYSDSVVFSVVGPPPGGGSGVNGPPPPALNRIRLDGSVRPFSTLTGFSDELKIASVRAGCNPTFPVGDLFLGNGSDGEIARVTDFGRQTITTWVSLPDADGNTANGTEENGLFRGGLHVDRTGVFDNDLIGVTTKGEVWKINPAQDATNLVTQNPLAPNQNDANGKPLVRNGKIVQDVFTNCSQIGHDPADVPYCVVELEGVFTVPNLAERYGEMAGKILSGAEELHRLYAVAPDGAVTFWQFDPNNGLEIEDIDMVLAGHNFFGAGQSTETILAAPESEFASLAGELLATQEFDGTGTALARLYWVDDPDGAGPAVGSPAYEYIPRTVDSAPRDEFDNPIAAKWEHVTFAPAGIVPATGVGIARGSFKSPLAGWTIFLDSNGNRHRDPDERVAITDDVGSYAFKYLAPGTYTVVEEPQSGWQQTFPLPVPGAPPGLREYSITITGEQLVGGIDFGNKPIVPQPNRPPQFTSAADEDPLPFDTLFQYNASAFDPDGDTLEFDLSFGPIGMMVEESTGIVVWVPTDEQVGTHAVLLRVRDEENLVDLQYFELQVTVPNAAPVITSTPPGPASLGNPYRYQVLAQDADGDVLEYTLPGDPPTAMTIDASGLLRWNSPTSTQPVSIRVSDGKEGGFATQTFDLVVEASPTNRPPVIASEPEPRERIQIGRRYIYLVPASDPDGDPLQFSLQAAPAGMSIDARGIVLWTPIAAQLGTHTVQVLVEDGRDGADEREWTIDVVSRDTNLPPRIVSSPPLLTSVGRAYRYDARAEDPDGDPVTWSLISSPYGMSIDEIRGTIPWTASAYQVGTHDVVLRALDVQGGVATQTFSINVRAFNIPPQIVSVPPTTGNVATEYTYAVRAIDPDGDALSFAITCTTGDPPVPCSPAMTIDGQTGLVRWTPSADETYDVSITVSDGQGGSNSQEYQIVVSADAANRPPVITSSPPLVATLNTPYSYQVEADDPESQTLAFSLVQKPEFTCAYGSTTCTSDEMIINPDTGLVEWTPSAAQENVSHTVTVRVTDPGGLRATQRFQVFVRPVNRTPFVPAAGPFSVAATVTFRYDVEATDLDGDPLSFRLNCPLTPDTCPLNLTVDSFGRVTWPTTVADIDSDKSDGDNDPYVVQIAVADDRGATFLHEFTVTVLPDTAGPMVDLRVDPNPADPNEQVLVLVSAVDSVGVADLRLTWCQLDAMAACVESPTNLPLDARGSASVSFSEISDYKFTATATDTAGNSSVASDILEVFDTDDPLAPDVLIVALRKGTDPATDIAASGAVITDPWNVVGTIDDAEDNLASWTLAISPLTVRVGDEVRDPISSDFRTIVTGTTEVTTPGVLGMFDPTILPNGPYLLRLSATDTGGNQSFSEVNIHVTGDLKLGNFTLAFTDLSIPVSGIPITVTRTYDTLRANEQGDFGYGWRLEMWDADVKVDQSTLGLGGFGIYPPFVDGTRVTITAMGGKPASFTFQPIPQILFFGLVTIWHPNFVGDPGEHDDLTVADAHLTRLGTGEYISYARGGITYNPADPAFGGTYDFQSLDGLTHHIDATTGDLLTLSDHNGNTLTFGSIESDTGRKVEFERDERGRITAIIDPKGQATANDPTDGRIEYTYDARGDLVAVKDRMGNVTRFSYRTDMPHFVDAAVDPAGVTAVQTDYANPTCPNPQVGRLGKLTDADGKDVKMCYDVSNRSQTITDQAGTPATMSLDPRGNVTRAVGGTGNSSGCAADGITCTAIAKAGYDDQDNLTSQTVIVGQEDSAANGETDDIKTEYTYNDLGVVVTQTDPLGNVTRASYNAAGQPIAVTDALGNTNRYLYDGGDAVPGSFRRPKPGNLILTADPLDNATAFEYDGRGDVMKITTGIDFNNWVYESLLGGGLLAKYDPNCIPTMDPACFGIDPNRRPDLAVTRFTYNQYGDLTSTTDTNNVTRNFTPDGNGNQTGSTFTWVNPNDPNDTRTVTTTNVINGNDQVRESIGPEGTTTTDYDALGRGFRITDVLGKATETKFDTRGQSIENRTQSEDENGNTVWLISRTVYDAAGSASYTTNAFAEGTPVASITGRHTIYDTLGRAQSTEEVVGLDIQITGISGNLTATLASPGTVVTTSSTTNGSANRLLLATDSFGRQTQYLYDRFGQTIETRTQAKDENGTDVWLVTRTVYDTYGRVELTTDRFIQPATCALGACASPPVRATRNVYDLLGRTPKVQRMADVVVGVQSGSTVVTNAGTLVSTSETIYNPKGQVARTIAADGQITDFEYDAQRRPVATIGHPVPAEEVGLGSL